MLVSIGETEFAYRRGKSCSDAIFVVRRLQEKYVEKKTKLSYFCGSSESVRLVPKKRWKVVSEKAVSS